MVGFSHNANDASIFRCAAAIPPRSRASFEMVAGTELADRAAAGHAGCAAPLAVHVVGQLLALPGGDLAPPADDSALGGSGENRRCTYFMRNSIRAF